MLKAPRSLSSLLVKRHPVMRSDRIETTHETLLLAHSFCHGAGLSVDNPSVFVARSTKIEKRDPRQVVEATSI